MRFRIQTVKLLLNTTGNFCHSFVIHLFNIRNINRMSKVHINAFTRCQPFQVSWTSICHWHDTDLSHFGNDGNTAFDILRMTASTWKHNQGSVALFQHIDRILNGFCSRIFTVDRKSSTHTNPPAKNTIAFANTISTTEGGTHEEGFRAALTSLVNRYARDKGILKDKDENLSGDDVREGLTAVISVKLTNPQFEGQTKTKLGNSEAKTFVQRVMTDKLGDWFDAHPNEAKNIIQKAIEASRARLAAKKARENTRRKSIFESAGMPDKLKDCQSNNPEECELFIVEGDSAGGSAIQGRNPITQAILPLRGKILNTERASLDRMMKSDTIESLITAVGGGYGEDFDISKVRYHKVIIMADADVDGAHIATLNLTLFFRYMRPMITAGYVYVAMPPLYRLKWTKGPHDFVYTDAERDRVLAEGKANGRQLPKGEGIQRYKGLGEMSYQELWETTMDPEHRILKQVHIEDAAAADETFSMLMGDEVEPRRLFIQRNAKNVRWIDA